jgi:osmotically-inducible protein OsmY
MTATLEVRPEGQNNAVLTIPNAKFNAGDTYTIVLTGKAKGAPKLEAIVIQDKLVAGTTTAGITREEYEKDKDKYAEEAKRLGRKIGAGNNDGWVWTKTRAALANENDLRDSTINVDVENEVVTLSGSVANDAQRAKAEKVARGVEGIKNVRNQLVIGVMSPPIK